MIYRDHLLPHSETFIDAQAGALTRYTPYFVGSRTVQGISIADDKLFVVNRGGWRGKLRETLHLTIRFDTNLLKQAQNLNTELIHAHFGPDGVTALTLSDRLQIPLIVTFHGSDITVHDDFARKSYYRQRKYLRQRENLKARGKKFISASKYLQRILIEKGYPSDKVIQHYIGIDLNKFEPNLAVPREQLVLFVGRLVPVKGCRYLIKAMQKVQTIHPDVRLVIIGNGPERADLEAEAEKTLTNYDFLGARSQTEVISWLERAKVFSVPSIIAPSGSQEGLGIAFIEAQAMGVPVASFSTGGIPEAVLHEKTGLLARPEDFESLADNILHLIGNKEQWTEYSRNAVQHVRVNFDLRQQTSQLEDIYDEVRHTANA